MTSKISIILFLLISTFSFSQSKVGTIDNDYIINLMSFANSLFFQYLSLSVGITLIGLGTAIYVGGDLGAGPRDGVMVGLEEKGLKIGTARTRRTGERRRFARRC